MVPLGYNADTLSFALAPANEINVYVPNGDMVDMPTMEIRKDVNYTIQIKKYTNTYPYSSKKANSKQKVGSESNTSKIIEELRKE